jgi:putative phage-type endonuclease
MDFLKESIMIVALDFPHSITNNSYKEKLVAYLKDVSKEFMGEDELALLLNHLDDMLISNHLIRSMNSFIRSYEEQIAIRPDIIEHMNYIKSIPQPEQRTSEWYSFRYNHITASNAWKAYSNKEKVKNQLIYEKCKPMDVSKYNACLSENPMSWGHKYEPVTIQLYEMFNNTTISEFGCIEHPIHTFLAASPDGIVTGNNNFGRMIEVKNVVSRIITGIPKEDYYIQMQLQMEVCNLDECDFIETKFVEYASYMDYMEDGSGCFTRDNKYKGVIKVYVRNNEEFIYEYMDLNCSNVEEWLDSKDTNYEWFKDVYWKLDVYSCVFVPRCKLWFDRTFEEIQYIWNIIVKERENGEYVARQPTKRVKKDIIKLNSCLITNYNDLMSNE